VAGEGDAAGRVERDALAAQQAALEVLEGGVGAPAHLAPRVHDAVPGDVAALAQRRERVAHLARAAR
jgi:hypothetical protein